MIKYQRSNESPAKVTKKTVAKQKDNENVDQATKDTETKTP